MFWSSSKPPAAAAPAAPAPAPQRQEQQQPQQVVIAGKDGIDVRQQPSQPMEIGIATIAGACSGFALKKIGKVAGFAIGCTFMGFQSLIHFGYLQVNWNKIEQSMISKLDQDNDGKLTQKDIQIGAARIIHLLSSDLPASGGFAAAFLMGFRYG